jgi:hypothetical protein
MKKLLVILLLFLPFISMSQQWKKTRKEILFGPGAANLLGDLGGADQIGTHLMKDLEISLTRPMVGGGYRYKLSPTMAVKGFSSWARLTGNDLLTAEPSRNNRNISFRTNIITASAQFEYSIIEEKVKSRYARKGKKFPLNIYFFGGFGFFYFNPQGQYYDGKWYKLKPLNTEGQGLPTVEVDGRNPIEPGKSYSLVQFCVPLGVGFKYPINREWSIGLEYSITKTFTDYIDDVSTTYYPNDAIRAAYGDVAAYFADPSTTPTREAPIKGGTNPGEKRGEVTYNDSFMFAWLHVSYKLTGTSKSRVKF